MPDPGRPPVGHEDHPDITSHNSRIGLILFFIYLLFYGGFMAISTFRPDLMAKAPFGGVNLAILYGLGLIVVALILAAVYMALCKGASNNGGK